MFSHEHGLDQRGCCQGAALREIGDIGTGGWGWWFGAASQNRGGETSLFGRAAATFFWCARVLAGVGWRLAGTPPGGGRLARPASHATCSGPCLFVVVREPLVYYSGTSQDKINQPAARDHGEGGGGGAPSLRTAAARAAVAPARALRGGQSDCRDPKWPLPLALSVVVVAVIVLVVVMAVKRHFDKSQIEVCQSRAACGQRPLSLRFPFRPTCSDHPAEYTCARASLWPYYARARNPTSAHLWKCTPPMQYMQ